MSLDDYEASVRGRARRLRILKIVGLGLVIVPLIVWRVVRIGDRISRLAENSETPTPVGFVGFTATERSHLQMGGNVGLKVLDSASKLDFIVDTFGAEKGASGRCTAERREQDRALLEQARLEGGHNATCAAKLGAALDRLCGP
jgi:hypothetical protein